MNKDNALEKLIKKFKLRMNKDKGLNEQILDELRSRFNNFERTTDRKYALRQLLRYNSRPFTIKKMLGSNQVLVYDNTEKLIYDSDNETIEQQMRFEYWLEKIIYKWLVINLP